MSCISPFTMSDRTGTVTWSRVWVVRARKQEKRVGRGTDCGLKEIRLWKNWWENDRVNNGVTTILTVLNTYLCRPCYRLTTMVWKRNHRYHLYLQQTIWSDIPNTFQRLFNTNLCSYSQLCHVLTDRQAHQTEKRMSVWQTKHELCNHYGLSISRK